MAASDIAQDYMQIERKHYLGADLQTNIANICYSNNATF